MAGESDVPSPVSVPAESARVLSADRAASVAAAEKADVRGAAPDDDGDRGDAETAAAALPAPTLTPKVVENGLRAIMNPLFRRGKLAPLDAEELRAGGEALAPAFNRYLPWILAHHGELVIAGMWVGGVVLLRLPEERPAPPSPPKTQTPAPADTPQKKEIP